jgi:hypothetical protein
LALSNGKNLTSCVPNSINISSDECPIALHFVASQYVRGWTFLTNRGPTILYLLFLCLLLAEVTAKQEPSINQSTLD